MWGWDLALGKSFFERAVITKTRSDVPPFRSEWCVGRAPRDVAADGHRAQSAAVIALAARENAEAMLPAALKLKLARKFDRGFSGFRATGAETDAAPLTKIRRSHREQSSCQFFPWEGVKLRS